MTLEDVKKISKLNIDPYVIDYLKDRRFSDFEIVEIPVGKIRRYLDGKVYSLSKTVPYEFLENPKDEKEQERYKQYCIRAKADNPYRSLKHFMEMINVMDDYSLEVSPILVDQNYFIIDGQHRACVTLYKYGKNHRIKVLKVYFCDLKYRGVGQKIRNLIYNVKKFMGIDI